MYADVALITEHHVIPFFAVRGAAHITNNILIVFDAQTFHRFNGVPHVVMTLPLQSLHGSFHHQFIYRRLFWNTDRDNKSEAVLRSYQKMGNNNGFS